MSMYVLYGTVCHKLFALWHENISDLISTEQWTSQISHLTFIYSPVEETKKNEEECHRYFAGLSVEYI